MHFNLPWEVMYLMKTKWPSSSFGDKRLLMLMKASPNESPDECGTERRSDEDSLGRQIGLHPSFYFPSFDSTVRQIEDCKPKTEAVMDNCSSFSQNILIIYFLSHRQAQKLAYRQLVSCCCYFGWCNRVILPSGAMLKVQWETWWRWRTHLFHTCLEHLGMH